MDIVALFFAWTTSCKLFCRSGKALYCLHPVDTVGVLAGSAKVRF